MTRTYTLDRPGLLPTMGGGYAVIADDSPLGPRLGDVKKIGPRWNARPMGASPESWHPTRRVAVDAIVATARAAASLAATNTPPGAHDCPSNRDNPVR